MFLREQSWNSQANCRSVWLNYYLWRIVNLRDSTLRLNSGNGIRLRGGNNFLFPCLRLRSGTRLRHRGRKLLSLKDYKSARLSYRCYALLIFLFCICFGLIGVIYWLILRSQNPYWVFMVISFLTTLFRVVFLFSIFWFPFYFFDEKIWFLSLPVDKLIKYRLDF